ncbi:TcmI family type II polyketide cyclase [Streptomyces sp. 2A115]|uniref:TcmI family type II polyketide cyclase n=1 Tax=Streptomyces sp. 2A115 TaxID=3457439 RepID=UPI003FD33488
MQRALLVMRMKPSDAGEVADIFAEHDKTGLPEQIGAVRRTLFHYGGLYFHLVEAPDDLDGDLMRRIVDSRHHPLFADTAERLKPLLTPIVPDWQSPYDSRAAEFYNWDIT